MSIRTLIFHPDCYKELDKLDCTQRQWALRVLNRLRDPALEIEKVLEPMGDRDDLKLSGTYKAKNRSTGMRMVVREIDASQAKLNALYNEDGKSVSSVDISDNTLVILSLAVGQKDDNRKVYKAAAKKYLALKKNDW